MLASLLYYNYKLEWKMIVYKLFTLNLRYSFPHIRFYIFSCNKIFLQNRYEKRKTNSATWIIQSISNSIVINKIRLNIRRFSNKTESFNSKIKKKSHSHIYNTSIKSNRNVQSIEFFSHVSCHSHSMYHLFYFTRLHSNK